MILYSCNKDKQQNERKMKNGKENKLGCQRRRIEADKIRIITT